jgi:molybdopterin-synthase adenylyltransferase
MNEHLVRHFRQPSRCPYCGSLGIEGRSVVIGGDLATQTVRCTGCGRSWSDIYRLQLILDDQQREHPRPGPRKDEDTTARSVTVPDRDLRQRDIIPPEALARCRPTVIGVGAIGRQVALQLAAMGVPWLQLIDPQDVEPVNLACQGYLQDDLGRAKVEATADICQQINHALEVHEVQERFRRSMVGQVAVPQAAIFCCVDAIETRRLIWEAVKEKGSFFADGRMSAEVVRVLTAADELSRKHYPTTLFAQDDAFRGSCTAKSTIFTANIAAGLMLEQFSRWLRRLPVDPDLTLNLLASELATAP